MRRRPLQHQHFEDGGVEFVGAVARKEAVEAGDGAVQRMPALSGAGEELGAGRDGVGQAVGEARFRRPALIVAQRLNVGGILDLGAGVVATRMTGDLDGSVEDADLFGVGQEVSWRRTWVCGTE